MARQARLADWPMPDEQTPTPQLIRLLNDYLPQMAGYVQQSSGLYLPSEYRNATSVIAPPSSAATTGGPGGVANCILWVRARDLALTHVNGDTVGSWYDQSGSANHGSDSAATTKPTFVTNVFGNSQPGVHFSGGFIRFQYAQFSGLTQGEAFVVMKRDTSPPPNTGARGFWYFSNDSVNPAQVPTPVASGAVIWDNFGTTATKNTGVAFSPGTSPAIYNVLSATNLWTINVNNSQVYTTATNTVGFNNGSSIAQLGADYNGGGSPTYYYVGYFGELIVFSTVLSTTDRAIVYNYLSTQYAI